MSTAVPLLTVALLKESDIVSARQRARQIAGLLGFEAQDQTRIATAVSEIARNAATYGGGGRVEFAVDTHPAALQVRVRDRGPGIDDLDRILEGRFKSTSGMGVGIAGTRRLMDRFEITSVAKGSVAKGTEGKGGEGRGGGGTVVTFAKLLPRGAAPPHAALLGAIGKQLASSGAADPVAEMRTQNQELLQSLAALQSKQDEAERLYLELEKTNRGVVALYAELDEKAAQLAAVNAGLETRVAAAVAECQHANDALRQSQKMEAVGQLTGGIAHDFNNLLQIVVGNLELIARRVPPQDDRLRRAAHNAMSGAQRAATLTQRLLAFSRQQPLSPKPVDPNTLVEGMSELMSRTLGETVKLETHLANGLWIVEIDAHQLENALLNLAVNARDAMQPGGVLAITTANGIIGDADAQDGTAPGHYVSITVRDTGTGMTEAVMARVFEPFFTTKEVGKGTGLGLSMVYGFVKQSGGHLRLESSVGRGTTVTLYLPRVIGDAASQDIQPIQDIVSAEPAHDGETVLVVEDDPDVRSYSCDVLRELGYRVLEAADGPAAIAILEGNDRIDLLFTDMVLTGPLNGRQVSDRASLLRPGLPVLFTSGYARDRLGSQTLADGTELLAKPFTYDDLATRVRVCLQAAAG